MKTLRDVLLGNKRAPSGQGWSLQHFGAAPDFKGPFVLTEDYDIIDTVTQNRFIRDREISLETAMLNVPGLTTTPTNVAYLFALAVKPLFGLSEIQIQANTNLLPRFLNEGLKKEKFEAEDVFWVVPDGGVEVDTDKLYIPGFSKYFVDANTNAVMEIDPNDPLNPIEVIAGTNRGNLIVLEDDHGEFAEVNQANIVLLARGKATEENFDAKIYFLDNDTTNFSAANMTTEAPVVDNATSAITDPDDDFVIGNEINSPLIPTMISSPIVNNALG